MKCRYCGAEILNNDIFCVECGKRVEPESCSKCGQPIRVGTKFCSKCGHPVSEILSKNTDVSKQNTDSLYDDEIPVTGMLETKDIPFDLIEKNILLEAARQISENEADSKDFNIKSNEKTEVHANNSIKEEKEDYYEEPVKKEAIKNDDFYEDSLEEDYDDYYEDDNYDNEEDYDEEFYEDEVEDKSLLSRLLTAGMIVIGLIIILIIAWLFFSNRNKRVKKENTTEIVQETEEEISDDDGTIGTINIVKDVNIRDGASTENTNVLGVARVGETYSYYGYAENSTNWVHIKVNDETDGYVYSEYIEIIQ